MAGWSQRFAAALLGVGVYDWQNINDVLKGAKFLGTQIAQVGWGLELGTVASGALMVAAVVLLLRRPQLAPQAPQAPAPPPVDPPA